MTARAATVRNAGEILPLTFSERRTQPTPTSKKRNPSQRHDPAGNWPFELCADNWLTEAGPAAQPTWGLGADSTSAMLRQFNAFASAAEIPVDGKWKNLPSGQTFVAPESWRECSQFRKLCLAYRG
jgi:hypothetical protein